MMKKKDLIRLFNTQQNMAKAIGMSDVTISGWDDKLDPKHSDRVVGAMVRLGLIKGELDVIDQNILQDHGYKGLKVRY